MPEMSLKQIQLLMKIHEVYMQATGEQFSNIQADPMELLDRISRELSQRALAPTPTYTCVAGTHDMGERNYKFSGNAHLTLDAAMQEWNDQRLGTYPWSEIEVDDERFRTTIDPFDVALRLAF